jgi:hypothetical protein
MDTLLGLVTGRQGPSLAEPPDLFGELLAHLMRSVEEGLGGDETLGEQVAERRGSFGPLDVDQFVIRAEQVADLDAAARGPERVADPLVLVQAHVSGSDARDVGVVIALVPSDAQVPRRQVERGLAEEEPVISSRDARTYSLPISYQVPSMWKNLRPSASDRLASNHRSALGRNG